MSALEFLNFPLSIGTSTVIEILSSFAKTRKEGFDVIFSVPGHVGILVMNRPIPLHDPCSITCSALSVTEDFKNSNTELYFIVIYGKTWDQQVLNKLHSIHPSTSHWAHYQCEDMMSV
ncbi:hypothetical protein TNCV_1579071 [Trichonephila clavipes]|nr:hypothetical protein TNCV_1579071 [Trichonephila clavipes]